MICSSLLRGDQAIVSKTDQILSAAFFRRVLFDIQRDFVKILYQSGAFPTIDLKAAVEELSTYAIPTLFAEAK